MEQAQKLLDSYEMQPHPEGGYYKETERTELMSNCNYMLVDNQRTGWRRITYDELVVYCQGEGLEIDICNLSQTEITTHKLGHDT